MEIFEEVNKELGTKYKSDKEIRWYHIVKNYKLSEQFIEKYANKLNWRYVSRYQILSIPFIRKWKFYVDWKEVALYQKLDNETIIDYKDFLDWDYISAGQFLSEERIDLWWNKLSWYYVSFNQKLSKEFIEKWQDRIVYKNLRYNVLTQSNIGRDWFIAYIEESDFKKDNVFLRFFLIRDNRIDIRQNLIKVRIFYKDLITAKRALKVKELRKVNKYKICGKKDGNI